MAIRFYQGDSSNIIIIKPDDENINILDPAWKCKMVCTQSETDVRIILEKQLSKDPVRKIFFTILSPAETMKFMPGKYIAAFELTNEDIMYRREIHDKIRVKPQVVWDKPFGNSCDCDEPNVHHGCHDDPLGCIPSWSPHIPAIVTGPQGKQGLSAYEVAVQNGFQGTQEQWVLSLTGARGPQGDKGESGMSAYDTAKKNGFLGTEAEWLDSLIGPQGRQGIPGYSAYEIAVQNGFQGSMGEWLLTIRGPKGDPGVDGQPGKNGQIPLFKVENGSVWYSYGDPSPTGGCNCSGIWKELYRIPSENASGNNTNLIVNNALTNAEFSGDTEAQLVLKFALTNLITGAPSTPFEYTLKTDNTLQMSHTLNATTFKVGRAITDKIVALEQFKDNITPKVNTLEQTINTHSSKIASLETSNATLLGKIGTLENKTQELESKNTTLTNEVVGLKDSNTALQQQLGALATRVAALESGSATPTKHWVLTVNTNVPNGKWSTDGGTIWNNSGPMSLVEGLYNISFKQVFGYNTPSMQSINLNQNVELNAVYIKVKRQLKLILSQALDGAKWSVDDGSNWHDFGINVELDHGNYVATFKPVKYYVGPSSMSINLDEDKEQIVTYQRDKANLIVNITGPVSNGKWSVDGGSNWYDKGTQVELDQNVYTVTFSSDATYTNPEPIEVDLFENKTIEGHYLFKRNVKVTFKGNGATIGAWKIEGLEMDWKSSGEIVEVDEGTYNVVFKEVEGYHTPQTVSIDATNDVELLDVFYDTTSNKVKIKFNIPIGEDGQPISNSVQEYGKIIFSPKDEFLEDPAISTYPPVYVKSLPCEFEVDKGEKEIWYAVIPPDGYLAKEPYKWWPGNFLHPTLKNIVEDHEITPELEDAIMPDDINEGFVYYGMIGAVDADMPLHLMFDKDNNPYPRNSKIMDAHYFYKLEEDKPTREITVYETSSGNGAPNLQSVPGWRVLPVKGEGETLNGPHINGTTNGHWTYKWRWRQHPTGISGFVAKFPEGNIDLKGGSGHSNTWFKMVIKPKPKKV